MLLKNKIAIVTGASRGIGRSIALGLAREGSSVVVNYNKNEEMAVKVVKEINALGCESIMVRADVSRKRDVERMVKETLEKFGKIDILVNNAGSSSHAKFLEITEELWDRTFEVHVKGVFLCSQTVSREMVKQREGKIINISSISAKVATSTLIHYCATEAAIDMLTKGTALALGPYNIQVNSVAPGVIETDPVKKFLKKPANKKPIVNRTPSGIIGQPEDCVGAVLFLASESSKHINGGTIVVDGGYIAQGPEWDILPAKKDVLIQRRGEDET